MWRVDESQRTIGNDWNARKLEFGWSQDSISIEIRTRWTCWEIHPVNFFVAFAARPSDAHVVDANVLIDWRSFNYCDIIWRKQSDDVSNAN